MCNKDVDVKYRTCSFPKIALSPLLKNQTIEFDVENIVEITKKMHFHPNLSKMCSLIA
jgi:hypothetical protein